MYATQHSKVMWSQRFFGFLLTLGLVSPWEVARLVGLRLRSPWEFSLLRRLVVTYFRPLETWLLDSFEPETRRLSRSSSSIFLIHNTWSVLPCLCDLTLHMVSQLVILSFMKLCKKFWTFSTHSYHSSWKKTSCCEDINTFLSLKMEKKFMLMKIKTGVDMLSRRLQARLAEWLGLAGSWWGIISKWTRQYIKSVVEPGCPKRLRKSQHQQSHTVGQRSFGWCSDSTLAKLLTHT